MTVLFVIGRIVFGLFFIYSGINHLTHVGSMSGYAKSKAVPAAGLAVVVTGLLLLLGGLSIFLGVYPVVGLILLIVVLIPVTLWMHSFWADKDPMQKMGNVVNFTKNLALVGAILMMFLIPRPWPFSLIS